jgi:FkbM family methyltransferase
VAYSFKHKLISWVSKTFFDNFTYTVRNGLNKGLRRKGGLGWVPKEQDTAESLFWKSLDLKGKSVYDVGAFHGLLTMFFARTAKRVVAWEPTSRNRKRLEENIRLNSFSNVVVRPYGLSSSRQYAEMSFDSLVPGTASLDAGIASGKEHEQIELRTLDEEQGLEAPDLIKVDVEGFELEVLKGASGVLSKFPDLFLEMHGADPQDKQRRVTAIVDHLWKLGYRNIQHVESKTAITRENAAIASQGHLYVRRA